MNLVEAASHYGELQAAVQSIREFLNIDHVVYHWVSGDGDPCGCGTYPQAWIDRYIDRDYVRVDPVIHGCFQRFHPVDWRHLDWTGKAVQRFSQDAIQHGVGAQGYSVPVRGPHRQFALFSANHDADDAAWDRFIERHRHDMILMAHSLNLKALEFEPDRATGRPTTLSPREVDAMTLLALGYGRAQIAQTLSISEHTLRVYIESARHKLGAINTVNAVARALNQGLIGI